MRFLPHIFSRFQRAYHHRHDVVRRLAHDGRRSFWAMADQGVASLGNFGLHAILATGFAMQGDLAGYGMFLIILEWMFQLKIAHEALVIYPLNVRGAVASPEQLGRLAGTCMALTLLAAAPLVSGAFVVGWIVHTAHTGLWVGLALLLWQFQETLRRSLTCQNRFRAAVVGDSVSYLGQLVVLGLVAATGKLSLVVAFQTMALTTTLAIAIQAVQVRLSQPDLKELFRRAAEFWRLGRWVLGSSLSNIVAGPLFITAISLFAGEEMLGIFGAILMLLRPVNPLMFALTSMIVPQVARTQKEQGATAARSVFKRYSLLGSVLLLPYLSALTLFAIAWPLVSDPAGDYSEILILLRDYPQLLLAMTLVHGLIFLAGLMGAFLEACERPRWSFHARLFYCAAQGLLTIPLTALFGLQGAVWGWLAANLLLVIASAWYVHRLKSHPPMPLATAVAV